MPDTVTQGETTVAGEHEPCEDCPHFKEIRRRLRLVQILENAVDKAENKLKDSDKFTVAEYIKLIQMEQEMRAEEPAKEVVVTWIEPDALKSE